MTLDILFNTNDMERKALTQKNTLLKKRTSQR